jgi:hypothetical protein
MRTAIAVSAALLLSRPVFNQSANSNRISVDEAIAAIEWGRAHDVQPYPIKNGIHGGSPVGAAFTPFVRIALAAHAATVTGGALDLRDFHPSLGERLVYLAMWNDFPVSTVPTDTPLRMELLPEINSALLGSEKAVQPTWFSLGDSSLAKFGATLDHDVAAVGAFPLDALTRGRTVVLYRSAHDVTVTEPPQRGAFWRSRIWINGDEPIAHAHSSIRYQPRDRGIARLALSRAYAADSTGLRSDCERADARRSRKSSVASTPRRLRSA